MSNYSAMLPRRPLLLPVFFFTLSGALVSSELSLEFGYSITTVLDFNKPLPSGGLDGSGIYPFALQPLTRAPNLLVLDKTNSAFFSLDLPLSQESRVRLLSGKGNAGFSDGDAISARFDRPRSFAVDSNDNVYVADRINHAIRKINGFSGITTTIAGGYSKKPGHADGPAQNATFSEDFDILFMHRMCSLLITDRASRLIRRMDLKPEDCEEKPQSSKGLGAIPVSAIALLALLCGLALGFIARPFLTPSSTEASMNLCSPHLRNRTQMTRTKPAPMFCSGIRSAVASYMRVVFRNIRLEKKAFRVKEANHGLELKDLIGFEEESGGLDLSYSANRKVETEEAFLGRGVDEAEDEGGLNGKIDGMMEANLLDFSNQIEQLSVVKRRISGVRGL